MQRSAGLVLLALVGEVALGHIQCFGHAFMEMRRNGRAGVHNDVQHYGPQSVIRVADTQRDVAFTGEGETIRPELTVEYFLIDHDAVSRIEEPRADLISEAARSFLELTKKAPCGTESSAERHTQDCAGTIMVRKKDKLKTRYYPDQNRPLPPRRGFPEGVLATLRRLRLMSPR